VALLHPQTHNNRTPPGNRNQPSDTNHKVCPIQGDLKVNYLARTHLFVCLSAWGLSVSILSALCYLNYVCLGSTSATSLSKLTLPLSLSLYLSLSPCIFCVSGISLSSSCLSAITLSVSGFRIGESLDMGPYCRYFSANIRTVATARTVLAMFYIYTYIYIAVGKLT